MQTDQKRRPLFLYFLLGSFLLFLAVLVGFALLWEGAEEYETSGGGKFARFSGTGAVGIVEIQGTILDSAEVVDELNRFRKSDRVRAIVLRIDSPGGAVAPSQEIYDEIMSLRADEESRKFVVASLGSVAASGGYYIASAADRIVANPGTLTGSIGVIMEFARFEELLGKIGVHSEVITNSRGKFKDVGSPFRKMTAEEQALLKSMMDNVYEQFVAAIADGREMDPSEIYPLADGRVFSGEQALDNGLVDEIGGFEHAIGVAADLAGIEGEPVRLYPRKDRPSVFNFLEDFENSGKTFLSKITRTGAPTSGLYYLFAP